MFPWEEGPLSKKEWDGLIEEYLICGSCDANLMHRLDEYQQKVIDELKRAYERIQSKNDTELPMKQLLSIGGHLEGFWGALREIIRNNRKYL